MNIAFIILSLFFYTHSDNQLQTSVTWTTDTSLPTSDVQYYLPGNLLVWDDFKGQYTVNDRAAAVTVSGFGYQANVKTSGGSGSLDIKVYCYFHKNKSWVKTGRNTPYILKHEQHHFDISYIAATIFLQKLQNAKFTTANYDALLAQIYNESTAIMNSMQDDYDGETKNGQLHDIQAKWNDTVEEKINNITR